MSPDTRVSPKRSIPFFNYQKVAPTEGTGLMDVIRDVLNRGAFILQKDLQEFETRLAAYLNVKHAIGMSNCTDGLILALRAAGLGPGDEIIFPSHTFVATASAIHFVGACPVPVECGPDHLMDPVSAERAITPRTRAIMPVQLNGRVCDMDPILQIAKSRRLLIIEDSAQALGAKYKGKCAGTFGLAAAFSFYPAKTLGCFGDGGAVVTDDEKMAREIRLLRDHGRDEKGDLVSWGLNCRLDNLQAAILNFKLRTYDDVIRRRREIARIYHERLKAITELVLPPPPDSDPDRFDIYQNYEIEAVNRDSLRTHLSQAGIGTILQWGGAAVHQSHALGFNIRLPFTERVTGRSMLLPMNPMLSDDDVFYICDKISAFHAQGVG